MKTIKTNKANSNLMPTIIILAISLGIVSIVFNIKLKHSHKTKWNILQAQQASVSALFVAREMLQTHSLPQNCINTSGCPFWGGHHNIRLNNRNGTPNKLWWNTNGYSIENSINNAKFIIIEHPNNIYKIISFAEDLSGSQSMISSGYVLNIN